jgi:hypothetical protein
LSEEMTGVNAEFAEPDFEQPTMEGGRTTTRIWDQKCDSLSQMCEVDK